MSKDCTLPVKFISAGLSACTADLLTFPIDTAKVRLQVQGEGVLTVSGGGTVSGAAHLHKYRGMLGTLAMIAREEGTKGLYGGLSAGLQRQLCFASIRIGFYDDVKKQLHQVFGNGNYTTGLLVRVLSGLSTGALSVAVAQPTDVVKVRMQAQGISGITRYTGALHAYRSIFTQEGIRGLWKGALPNMARNSITNASELVAYDMLKETVLKRDWMKDNLPCHVICGFGAGLCATLFASPVDVVKTRYMNSPRGQYSGAFHCAVTMAAQNGLAAFYKGCVPAFIRLSSWNVLMFVTFEQMKRLFSGDYTDFYKKSFSASASHPPTVVGAAALPLQKPCAQCKSV